MLSLEEIGKCIFYKATLSPWKNSQSTYHSRRKEKSKVNTGRHMGPRLSEDGPLSGAV